jgi:predicted glycogen debranching enzyme
MRFGSEICSSLEASSQREWLETNGLGGFASSTICGWNTRRYHGLLIAATDPPVGRVAMLSKLEETVVVDGRPYELGVNEYPGAMHPRGDRYLVEFRLDPSPVFVYRVEDVTIVKRIRMTRGENTTVIEYEANREIELVLRPLVAFRDYHSLQRENGNPPEIEVLDSGTVRIAELYLKHPAGEIEPGGGWYRNFEYTVERSRGLDFREDLFQPCVLRFRNARQVRVAASTSLDPSASASASCDAAPGESLTAALRRAAGAFLVARGGDADASVIAGYHWFSDWGRDTMISLPGLTLCTGRPEVARRILETYCNAASEGMLPNRFSDNPADPPEYNTVDATLWMFEAVRQYLAHTGDREFVVSALLPKLEEIVDWHVRGTRYGIRVDPKDGLLACGEDGVQLTWMDAKAGDWVVTPRTGKPVEIQALWYNALCTMQELSPNARYREHATRCRTGFRQKFWNNDAGCLFDCVDDPSIRPNQIFALSLGYTMIDQEHRAQILGVVERELLTPMGLRTLSPTDPRYRGRYTGGILERDGAYHQGTAWPWLLGPYLRALGDRDKARQLLEPFREHLRTAGLGFVSEVADGDAPHTPGGCIAQAWSVAELLRAAVELGVD